MALAPPLFNRALTEARADWLAGDPSAWTRYAACVTCLEQHLAARPDRREPARPVRPRRPGLRRPRGQA